MNFCFHTICIRLKTDNCIVHAMYVIQNQNPSGIFNFQTSSGLKMGENSAKNKIMMFFFTSQGLLRMFLQSKNSFKNMDY